MKLNMRVVTNLKIDEAQRKVEEATEASLRDVVVAIANDAIKGSPKLTGNNARSIAFKVKGLSGSIYSTSGYGGYLETGTVFMAPRPYFKPALDRNIHKLPAGVKARLQ